MIVIGNAHCPTRMGIAPMASLPSKNEPRCKKCDKLVHSMIVMPSSKPGHEERLYRCAACKHSETVFVELT